jgi:hypothetical protein
MIDFSKIKNWKVEIDKINIKLKEEKDFKKVEKLRLKIRILELRIKLERLS